MKTRNFLKAGLVVGTASTLAVVGCTGAPTATSGALPAPTGVAGVTARIPAVTSQLSQLTQVAALIGSLQGANSASGATGGNVHYRVAATVAATSSLPDGNTLTESVTSDSASGSTYTHAGTAQITDPSNAVLESSSFTDTFTQTSAPYNGSSPCFTFGGDYTRNETVSTSRRRPVGQYADTGSMALALCNLGQASQSLTMGATDSVVFTPQGQTATYAIKRVNNLALGSTGGTIGMNASANLPGGLAVTFGATGTIAGNVNSQTGVVPITVSYMLTASQPGSGSIAITSTVAGTGAFGSGSSGPVWSSVNMEVDYTDAAKNKIAFVLNQVAPSGASVEVYSGVVKDASGTQVGTIQVTSDVKAHRSTGVITFSDGSTANVDLTPIDGLINEAFNSN